MKKILTLISICTLFVLFGCTLPSGVDVTQRYNVNDTYYYLYVADGMNVTVTDEVDVIVITGDENVMEKIKVELTSSTLRIFRKDISLAYPNTTEVLIPYNPRLREVEVGMDSEFHTEFGIGDPDLKSKVTVTSRGKFDGYVEAQDLDLIVKDNSDAICYYDVYDKLYLKVQNSSSVEMHGNAENLELNLSDYAEIENTWNGNYYSCWCNYCYGSVDTYSTARVDCDEEISVSVTQGSYLYYSGDPYIGDSYVDGTSDMEHSGGWGK